MSLRMFQAAFRSSSSSGVSLASVRSRSDGVKSLSTLASSTAGITFGNNNQKEDNEQVDILGPSFVATRSYVTSASSSRFYARRRRFQRRPPQQGHRFVPHQHQHPSTGTSTSTTDTPSNNVHQQPTMAVAQAMPLAVSEMDNSTLVVLGELGDPGALEEILKRHIMVVDQVDYETATRTFYQIAAKNAEGMYLLTFPYYAGITIALGAGFASFPLVFDLGTADWFNANFVTTDIPESEDLETALEVGAWTWNWMEPPLGQISFFLLCLQFSRAQMDNVGIKPYTKRIKQMRALHLTELFPKYNAEILMNYSKNCSMLYKPPPEAVQVLEEEEQNDTTSSTAKK